MGPSYIIKQIKLNQKKLKKNDIFLCDSGGQYRYGTTDVTRTICFSNQKNIKEIYKSIKRSYCDSNCKSK